MNGDNLLYVSIKPLRCYVLTQRVHHGLTGLAGGGLLAFCLRGRFRFLSVPLVVWGLSDYRDVSVWLRRDRIRLGDPAT